MIDLPLRAQLSLIDSGAAQPQDIDAATCARIARRDPDLRSIVHMGATDARCPIGIKDIFDVDGMPTRCGSHAHRGTGVEATAVTRLRAAGLTPRAKLATYEYALTGPAWDQPNPPARNPWNVEHITGGSSSGSAAAVAGGLFRAALGTDTGGSIRAPAAYCGIVGLKPTHGLVPEDGCFPLSPSLDVIGPLAACVEDAAFVMEALAPESAATRDLGQGIAGLRIGYARDWFATDKDCHPDLLRAMDDAAALLTRLGARIDLVTLSPYAPLEAAGCVIIQAEAWEIHKGRLATSWEEYGVDARRNLFTGAILTPEHVTAAMQLARSFRAEVDENLAEYSALLAPTTLAPAPKFSDFEDGPFWTAMRTLPFNMTGHPAISVPCGFAGNGLPLGMQLIGARNAEALLCRIGHAFEQASDSTARPALAPDPANA
nr:amidase [Salipiger mangrovisoli]